MLPNTDILRIIEGRNITVKCVVNEDAAPPPVITWYLKYKAKTSIIGRNTTFINFTGNRTDNYKTLKCQARNNNVTAKTASTLLAIECK